MISLVGRVGIEPTAYGLLVLIDQIDTSINVVKVTRLSLTLK